MNNELVSVIVPVYNTKIYLLKCVQSIIDQDYSLMEIILVDDGSTDGSGDICDSLQRTDIRIQVIHKPNGGLSSARLSGVKACTGDYVLFVDSDDWIDTHTISVCLNTAREEHAQCVFFSNYSEYENCTEEKHPIIADDLYRRLFGPYGIELKHPEQIDSFATCWGKFYRREVLNKAVFYHTDEVANAEDTLFNIHALYGDSIVYCDCCLYHYRKTNPLALTKKYRASYSKQILLVYQQLFDFIEKNNLGQDYYDAICGRITFNILSVALNELKCSKISEGITKIKTYICSKEYIAACRSIENKYVSFPWRFIIFLCKMKMAASIFFAFWIIRQIKRPNRL